MLSSKEPIAYVRPYGNVRKCHPSKRPEKLLPRNLTGGPRPAHLRSASHVTTLSTTHSGLTPEAQRPPSLVDAAMAGDPAALSALWENNRRWVAAVLLAHKPVSADLDDLLQEVAITVLAKITTLDNPANFQPWLRVVAMNVGRLAGRKHAAGPRLVRFDGPDDDPQSGPSARLSGGESSKLDVNEEAQRVMALAMDLHPDYREPLLLRCVQELSYAQIGGILGLPETTIETRIARGRRMLRERALAASVLAAGRSSPAASSPAASGPASGLRMAASPDVPIGS